MPAPLMKSVSGIRGIVGESFTPDLVVRAASAFASFTGRGMVVVGRDTRPSGDSLGQCLQSVLILSGCNVVDVGVVPTPTVQIMVEELSAAGGIVISASHNPMEWNALKLISSNGSFLNQAMIKRFFALMEAPPRFSRWNRIGKSEKNGNAFALHMNRVMKVVKAGEIRKAAFSVALDSVNGAGSLISRELLAQLGCTVVPVHCTPDGQFPRGAEPLPENLSDLSKAVKRKACHIGFAQDPDADRLAIVDERGKPIGEENTLALVTKHLLSKKPGRVVVNMSTTQAVADIARQYGSSFKRTRVGEINVADEMRKGGARIGGEGNGGVISPEVHLGRDSLAGICYILEMMAERGKSVSELVAEIPSYHMIKGKVRFRGAAHNLTLSERMKESFRGEKFSTLDGVRIDFIRDSSFRGGWVHLRPSNTEPIFRIIAEGRDEAQARRIYSHFKKFFTSA